MEPKIVYEDEFLIVLEKPTNWVVNDANTTKNPVVQSWLTENFDYPLAKDKSFRSGVVHRLDKETSGLLLVAKTKESFEGIQKQFKERKVKKEYTALVHGEVDSMEGEINAPVGRLPWNRERFGVLPGGRVAVTNYRVLSVFSRQLSETSKSVSQLDSRVDKPKKVKQKTENKKQIIDRYSLLELNPQTGRTHQIRIHLKYLGHPIVSDNFYAGRKTARNDRKWCSRLFLHASGISILHPQNQKRTFFSSELPQDLKLVLDSLEKSN